MKALTASAIASLLSASAFAENMPSTTANTTNAAGAAQFMTHQGAGEWRVGSLWDKNVYNAAGKSIGDLKDVIIDKDGRVTALVIGVGGFLGLGEKNVAIDYNYFQKNGGITPDRITLGMTEQDLRNAPSFQRESNR